MVSDRPTLRNLRLVHGVSDRRGLRHWVLVLSVLLVDIKQAVLFALEYPFIWAVKQLPADQARRVAARYGVRNTGG